VTNVAELMKGHEKLLMAELDLARAAVKHSTQKGSILEKAVLSLLESFLPEQIGVSEGIVIDSEGFVSNQLDVILYDKPKAQRFLNSASTKVVPAEFVYAVGEIKTSLDKAAYDHFEAVQAAVKTVKRHYGRPLLPAPQYNAYGRRWSKHPIASFLFCFEGSADATYQWAKSSHQSRPVNLCIDTIVCPGEFSIRRASDEGADFMVGRPLSLDCSKDHALFMFLGMLAKLAAQWKLHRPVEIYRYYSSVKDIPNSLITPLNGFSVEHDDLIAE
jgi:RNA binding exosome subunit